MSLEDWNLGFSHPCTIQISGPTGCGKTRFVRQVLENRLIHLFLTRLIWVFGEWQEDYEALRALYPHIEFVHGWRESLYDSICRDEANLLVLTTRCARQATRSSWRGCSPRARTTAILASSTWCKMFTTRERAHALCR